MNNQLPAYLLFYAAACLIMAPPSKLCKLFLGLSWSLVLLSALVMVGEVASVGPADLRRLLGDEEGWRAWEKSNGVDRDPVKARSAPKSIGCSKTFPGKAKLT